MKIVLPKKGTGIFIPEITVEMFRNAHLEFVEELLAEGEMVDIDIEEMKLLAYQRGLLQMKEAIDETLAEMPCMEVLQNKWIPVSERLPENDEKVLCQTVTKKGQINMVIGYYNFDRWCCGMNSNVIAWMPLPEPYEESEEE